MLITWAKVAQRWGLSFVLLRIDVYPLFHLQTNNFKKVLTFQITD